MTAFDTDILTDLFAGQPDCLCRAAEIPSEECRVPIVAAAEVLRGWLAAVRQAEASKGRMTLEYTFGVLDRSIRSIAGYRTLAYTTAVHEEFKKLVAAKIRIGTNDLRIAAICMAHNATLVTRNARDYTLVPGLNLEVWN